jgi:hypothetical protein
MEELVGPGGSGGTDAIARVATVWGQANRPGNVPVRGGDTRRSGAHRMRGPGDAGVQGGSVGGPEAGMRALLEIAQRFAGPVAMGCTVFVKEPTRTGSDLV